MFWPDFTNIQPNKCTGQAGLIAFHRETTIPGFYNGDHERVAMLSGYWPLCGWTFYVQPVEGEPVCIFADTEAREVEAELWGAETISCRHGVVGTDDQFGSIQNALKDLKHTRGWKKVGYEGNFEAMAPAYNAAELYPPAVRTRTMLEEVFGPFPKDLA